MSAAPGPADARWFTVPNLISLARMLLTPVLCWLIVADEPVAATGLLVGMGVSDFVDGQLARRTKSVSTVGIVLDPASDRVLVVAVIVTLAALGDLPLWLAGPVLAREGLLVAAFLVLAKSGFGRPKVSLVGKAATLVLLIALPMLTVGWRTPGLAAFAAGGILYYAAGVGYGIDAVRWAREKPPQNGQTPPDEMTTEDRV